jgi:transposase
MKRNTKTQAVLKLLAQGLSVSAIAKKAKCSTGYVYKIRAQEGSAPTAIQYASRLKDISDTLDERGTRYGLFVGQADASQALKRVVYSILDDRGTRVENDQLEALEMICHKMARIMNGDPNYSDSWHDIAGYATLVADRLEGNIR